MYDQSRDIYQWKRGNNVLGKQVKSSSHSNNHTLVIKKNLISLKTHSIQGNNIPHWQISKLQN